MPEQLLYDGQGNYSVRRKDEEHPISLDDLTHFDTHLIRMERGPKRGRLAVEAATKLAENYHADYFLVGSSPSAYLYKLDGTFESLFVNAFEVKLYIDRKPKE